MVRSQSGQFFDHINNFRATVGRLAHEINAGLFALHRVQFDEPWKSERRLSYDEWQAYNATPSRGQAETLAPRPTSH